jgi:hypothetical protein
MRKIGFDYATLEPTVKKETDEVLVVPAVIAREIVHQYPEGMAYKPADELEKAAWTADHRWVTTDKHPDTVLLMRSDDVKGRIENPEFVKNLVDPATRRPMDRGIRADLVFFKRKLAPAYIDAVKQGLKNDVSIGFSYEEDRTPGEFRGQRYDYTQRNIFIDHVAAGVPLGRCPSPFCGIGVDAVFTAADPWEEGEKFIRSGHRPADQFDIVATIPITEGVQAVLGCPKGNLGPDKKCKVGTVIQSYLFDKGKFTLIQAKAWFEKHKGEENMSADCPICDEIKRLGVEEASKRLAAAFGKAAVDALKEDQSEREKAKKEQEARAGKYGIAVKEGGNVTKPGEFADLPDESFADPVNYRYPIDEAHVMAAWAYWNKPENRAKGGYSEEEWAKIGKKIEAAMKKHGHQVADEDEVQRSRRLIAETQSLLS